MHPKDPEEFTWDELLTSQLVVLGNEEAMRVYHWFEQFEASCRLTNTSNSYQA